MANHKEMDKRTAILKLLLYRVKIRLSLNYGTPNRRGE